MANEALFYLGWVFVICIPLFIAGACKLLDKSPPKLRNLVASVLVMAAFAYCFERGSISLWGEPRGYSHRK